MLRAEERLLIQLQGYTTLRSCMHDGCMHDGGCQPSPPKTCASTHHVPVRSFIQAGGRHCLPSGLQLALLALAETHSDPSFLAIHAFNERVQGAHACLQRGGNVI